MFQGRFDAAMAACQRGIALKPDYAKGHYHLGDVFAVQGRLDEAEKAYRAALVLRHNYAEAHNNLGNVLMRQGRLEDALASLRRALVIRPDFVEAYSSIGHILLQQNEPAEAEAAFRLALAAKPNSADILSSLGAALGNQGRLAEAEEVCNRAIAARPDYASAHHNLGNVLKEKGDMAAAETCYRKALSLKADFAEAHRQLGTVLCQTGRVAEGFAAFGRHAALAYGAGTTLRPGPTVTHKLEHDREQRAYLGVAEDAALENLRLADGGRLTGAAVNPHNKVAEIERQWQESRPQIVTIDELLTFEALEKLRRFCWGSTIWRAVYEGGYLGAMPEHGFASPLLAQIAEELRERYPAIFADHPLLHCWAFKYDSGLNGIKLHADFAAVNVNFWITPDEANLDPASGGLIVWDRAAPLDWDFMKYNTAEKEIRDFLAREGAKPVTIPYRANRAVIFDSDLFHQTDAIHFKPGYENRRINVTLLYGRRERA
jgi:tetratricopeptide (TPR) repeat protein